MDISHGLPFAHAMEIYAGEYEDIADAFCYYYYGGSKSENRRDQDWIWYRKTRRL